MFEWLVDLYNAFKGGQLNITEEHSALHYSKYKKCKKVDILLTNLSESSSIGKSIWTQLDAFLQLLINMSRLTRCLFWLSQTASSSLKDLHQENVKWTVIQQFKPTNEWPSLMAYF